MVFTLVGTGVLDCPQKKTYIHCQTARKKTSRLGQSGTPVPTWLYQAVSLHSRRGGPWSSRRRKRLAISSVEPQAERFSLASVGVGALDAPQEKTPCKSFRRTPIERFSLISVGGDVLDAPQKRTPYNFFRRTANRSVFSKSLPCVKGGGGEADGGIV